VSGKIDGAGGFGEPDRAEGQPRIGADFLDDASGGSTFPPGFNF
jgi:hypothetical protein